MTIGMPALGTSRHFAALPNLVAIGCRLNRSMQHKH